MKTVALLCSSTQQIELKTAGRRVKLSEMWDSWIYTSNTYMGCISPCGVQSHFGVIQCTFLKMACNSKAAGRRLKWTEIRDSGTLVIHMGYIIDRSRQVFGDTGSVSLKCRTFCQNSIIFQDRWSLMALWSLMRQTLYGRHFWTYMYK